VLARVAQPLHRTVLLQLRLHMRERDPLLLGERRGAGISAAG
jgi:hypothetical protein